MREDGSEKEGKGGMQRGEREGTREVWTFVTPETHTNTHALYIFMLCAYKHSYTVYALFVSLFHVLSLSLGTAYILVIQ